MKFDLIYMDPPWEFSNFNKTDSKRGAKKEYETQPENKLIQMARAVSEISKENSGMIIWTTDTHLQEMLNIIEASGFKYVTKLFTWMKMKKAYGEVLKTVTYPGIKTRLEIDKDFVNKYLSPKIGMGFYTRKQTESCYYAKRGSGLKTHSSSIEEVIMSIPEEHSKKPIETYQRIEELFGNEISKVELYARQKREGWTSIGNGITKRDILEDIKLLKEKE